MWKKFAPNGELRETTDNEKRKIHFNRTISKFKQNQNRLIIAKVGQASKFYVTKPMASGKWVNELE